MPAAKKIFGNKGNVRKVFALTTMVLPGAIWLLVFKYTPMFGVILAFKKFTLSRGGFIASLFNSPWSGLKNFEFLFTTNDSWIMIRNTLGYNIVWMILGTIVSLSFAIMLSEITFKKLSKTYQTLMFFPHFLSWVVAGYFFYIFLNPVGGVLNGILTSMGQTPFEWYSQTGPWPVILTIANLWKGTGYGSVMYLAAIAGIDRSMYEAATVDGASKWEQIKHITLPSLKTMIVILSIMNVGRIFSADFGLFYSVPRDSGALFNVTQVVDTFVYRALINNGRIDMSAAAGLFQSLVGFILIMVTNAIVRKVDAESSLF